MNDTSISVDLSLLVVFLERLFAPTSHAVFVLWTFFFLSSAGVLFCADEFVGSVM